MFLEPAKTIEDVGLAPGSIVADFGAGSGTYTTAIATALHGSGRVYAIDVQKNLLARLKATAVDLGLGNVETIWGDLERDGGTKLRDQTIDAVFMVNLLFQLPDRAAVLAEAKRILKPAGKGKLLVIDWSASFKNMGPAPDHVLSELNARSLIESAGFIFDRAIASGSYHYGILAHT